MKQRTVRLEKLSRIVPESLYTAGQAGQIVGISGNRLLYAAGKGQIAAADVAKSDSGRTCYKFKGSDVISYVRSHFALVTEVEAANGTNIPVQRPLTPVRQIPDDLEARIRKLEQPLEEQLAESFNKGFKQGALAALKAVQALIVE